MVCSINSSFRSTSGPPLDASWCSLIFWALTVGILLVLYKVAGRVARAYRSFQISPPQDSSTAAPLRGRTLSQVEEQSQAQTGQVRRLWESFSNFVTQCMPRRYDVVRDMRMLIPLLQREVADLKFKIDTIHDFMNSHTALMAECTAAWEKFAPYVAKMSPGLEGFDLSNPVNQVYALDRRKREFESILENYEYFLKINPKIEEVILHYLQQQKRQPLLLEGRFIEGDV